MKKILLLLSLFFTFTIAETKLEKIVIAGPPANVSHPIFRMIETGALDNIADKVEFKLWNNPDQLRAMIINKEVDFVAIPTNVGSILYNKKQPIKLLNVSVWGILKILSRDDKIKHLEDLKGAELVIPWRGDMPDIVLRTIMKKKNLGKEDIKLVYVSNPMDAAQQLIMRRADNILLPEPATSMVLRKTGSFPISIVAPAVYRSIDLQEEWGDVYQTEPKVPQAGIAVVGDMLTKPELVRKFESEYEKAMEWYKAHPKEAGELVIKYVEMFDADAIADSVGFVKLDVVKALDSKKDLDFFFSVLKEDNPKIIGGDLPDEQFYIKD
ncbi:MAG: ABC transporter substrate-binding protein [Campylobacterota bacterium]|nr:ABC transporter substrate-binding protein [Campylobacterota bacterium]